MVGGSFMPRLTLPVSSGHLDAFTKVESLGEKLLRPSWLDITIADRSRPPQTDTPWVSLTAVSLTIPTCSRSLWSVMARVRLVLQPQLGSEYSH